MFTLKSITVVHMSKQKTRRIKRLNLLSNSISMKSWKEEEVQKRMSLQSLTVKNISLAKSLTKES